MHVPAFGAFALGVFVGYLIWYFTTRLQNYTTDALAAVAGVFAGGAVVKFLEPNGNRSDATWWYPIGLLVGLVVYGILFWIKNKQPPALAQGPAISSDAR